MSADFRQYVDLTPLDVSPTQIYLDAIEVAKTVVPGFELRVGTIEDAMFQAFAYMSALNIGAINRLPDSLFLGAIKMIGTPYNDGTRATMNVTFSANTNDGATIPSGTIVSYLIQDDELEIQYTFETNTLLEIAANTEGDPLPTGTVACTCTNLGTIPVIPSSAELSILSYMPDVLSAVAAGSFVQGQDAEALDSFLNRGMANLASMTSALVTSTQAQNYVLVENPTLVSRCKVYDLTDKDGSFGVADANVSGHATVFVYGPQRLLTNTEKTTIQNALVARSVAGMDIGLVDPYLLDFKITATIQYYSTFDVSIITDTLTTNLVKYFSPEFSDFDEDRLRYNTVLSFILNHEFVKSVSSLSLAVTDSATVTNAVKVGNDVTYTATNTFAVGDTVTVSGITPSSLDSTSKVITERTATTFKVVNSSASGTYSSGGSASVTLTPWGSASGDDFLYSKKGSLLKLSEQRVVLTMQSASI